MKRFDDVKHLSRIPGLLSASPAVYLFLMRCFSFPSRAAKKFLAAVLLLACATVCAPANDRMGDPADLRLTIAAEGPSLTFSFANLDKIAIKIMSHMATSDEPQYDDLTLLVIDSRGGVHPMGFIDERMASAPEYAVIGPGKSYSEKIDLAAWNRREITQYKFQESADYQLILVYNDKDADDAAPHFGVIYSAAIRVHYAGGKFTMKPAEQPRLSQAGTTGQSVHRETN